MSECGVHTKNIPSHHIVEYHLHENTLVNATTTQLYNPKFLLLTKYEPKTKNVITVHLCQNSDGPKPNTDPSTPYQALNIEIHYEEKNTVGLGKELLREALENGMCHDRMIILIDKKDRRNHFDY